MDFVESVSSATQSNWVTRFLLIFSLVTCPLLAASNFEFSKSDFSDDERYSNGREHYEMLQKESQIPRYSKCWLAALTGLHDGCRALTEDVQHHLAIGFTNCFLLKTGRETYPCEQHQEIAECTGSMSSEAYNSYTTFFTHTQNICYFLLAQAWQEATEKTVNHLAHTADNVAQQMEDSSSLQVEIMKKQNDSIKNQETLIASGVELRSTIEESTLDVAKMLDDFKEATNEQKALIFEVFDRVEALQSTVMGELTGFYSLIFYTVSIIICYLVTSTPRTSGARFWLFCLMTLNVVTERLLVSAGAMSDNDDAVYSRLWLCRKLFSVCGVLLWSYAAYSFKDLNKINNELLITIQKQNQDMKDLLLSNYEESVCSWSSSESGISDHTFRAEFSDSDTESFVTTDSGRFTVEDDLSLMNELHDIRQATPLREMTPYKDDPSSPVSPMGPPSSGRRTRTKRVWNTTKTYNLRSRPNRSALLYNPIVSQESEQEFARKVKEMEKISALHAKKVSANLAKQINPDRPFFSSDEEF
ncbi:hypothetical protein CAPTEDRAFT_225333 [Capitella teleta]|uniref:Protein brambleberry n=1 Tax=Capitella teleta TaxID=283909 RepID=R7TP93_CAPTE|nr:hypothetical protein CAPTEDRAFT_225333 [Capitella teleta]|eukprot:ELT93311.1 hypothetical protein CAPTEDRAFT_225333 [Capitella teleta]